MRILRNLLLVVFLLGLVAFNVSFGLRRFEWRRQTWQASLEAKAREALVGLEVAIERELALLERDAGVRAGDDARVDTGARVDAGANAAGAPLLREDRDGALVLAWAVPGAGERAARAVSWREDLDALQARLGARVALLTGDVVVGRAPPAGAPDGRMPPDGTHDGRMPPAADGDGLTIERALRGAPGWRLLAHHGRDALVPPPAWRREEAFATVLTMAGVTLGLLFAGAVFLRLTARSFRLRETERYLRWIRRLSDRYRALMEGAADMILIVDPESAAVRETNAAARAALGLPEGVDTPLRASDPSPGPPPALADLFAGDDLQRLRDALLRARLQPGTPEAVPELRVRGTSGAELVVDARIAVVDVGSGHIAELSLRDLSAQKEVERRLQTSERLSSLGLLTAGVAHEINNPLEGIGNYIALLQSDAAGDEQRRRYLAAVKHGFERIRDIVRDLLHFSRPEVGPGGADLGEVVERALSMAAYARAFRGVEVVRTGLDRGWRVAVDAGRLEQVVLNLLLNAARATGGGRVLVSARTAGTPPARVELEVADEGPGIAPEHLGRVFDPFFTTQGGTGLGLSVSYGIVTAHGGTLTARNREQGGASFLVTLPVEGAREGGA